MPTDNKTRKRTEDAAADQAKHGDSCSSKSVDTGPPMWLASFGDDSTEPPALPSRDDAMVDKGVTVPTPCLSPVEMPTPTAAGDLLLVSAASTAMRTIFFPTASFLDSR